MPAASTRDGPGMSSGMARSLGGGSVNLRPASPPMRSGVPDRAARVEWRRHSGSVLASVRYGIPVLFVLGGILAVVLEPNSTGVEGLAMGLGAALAVLYMNVLYRQGARGDREREEEERAREYFSTHGRWPDES